MLAILELVRRLKTHPTAEEIYAQLRPTNPRLSLGTVYRNLHILAQQLFVIAQATTIEGLFFYGSIHGAARLCVVLTVSELEDWLDYSGATFVMLHQKPVHTAFLFSMPYRVVKRYCENGSLYATLNNITLCWKCNKEFDSELVGCPHCGESLIPF